MTRPARLPGSILLGASLLMLAGAATADGSLDWSASGWTPDGALSQSYPGVGDPVFVLSSAVTGNTGAMSSGTPLLNNGALAFSVDHVTNTGFLEIRFDFTIPLVELTFNIHDIDRPSTASWVDQLTLVATDIDGNTVYPDVTAGSHYQISGANNNIVTGTRLTDFPAITPIRFPQAVTSVRIRYGNSSDAMSDPVNQVIWLGDMSWRNEADLSISKDDSQLSYTPGASSSYTLIVNNAGPNAVTGATVTDILPAGTTINGAWTCVPSGGASCISGTPSGTTASGTGSISQPVDIPKDGRLVFTVPVVFSADPADY